MLPIRRESIGRLRPELEARLEEFNERHAGPRHAEYLGLAMREGGRLVAGLTGGFFWNVLYVDMLWVDSGHRGQRLGSTLLTEAEQLARARGCDLAYLSTFEFQAPGFYSARGYTIVGELPDVPKGSRRLWFAKTLAT